MSSEFVVKLTPQQIDQQYQLINHIDSGTYGNVLKYLHIPTNTFVAIKTLKDSDYMDSLEKEVKLMKQISHPNVLDCLQFIQVSNRNQFLLVMPFYQRNLKNCLTEIAQFDEKRKIWICLQIARGLNALHEKNIMHRDMKPANILVNQEWEIKICDFGFCRFQNSIEMTTKVGTPTYRDPNIEMGSYSYTKKCDIYSVGMIFDTIFRGQNFFHEVPPNFFKSEMILFKKNKASYISKLKCSTEMKSIILKCLEDNEKDRYNSTELKLELEKLWAALNNKQNSSLFEIIHKEEKIEANTRIFEKKKDLKVKDRLSMCETIKTEQDQSQEFHDFPSQYMIGSTPKRPIKMRHKYSLTSPTLKSMDSNKAISNINFFGKLLNLQKKTKDSLLKNLNFQDVYLYFVECKKNISKLEELQTIVTIPPQDKRIVIFIGLFGYFRFLKAHRSFLLQEKTQIQSIKGRRLADLSSKTKEMCVDLIDEEKKNISNAINPVLNELNTDKQLYPNKELSDMVIRMLSEGVERKFTQISTFCQKEIYEQFQAIVLHSRYKSHNQKEEERKKNLLICLSQLQ